MGAWTAGRVEGYREHGSWLDASIAAPQVAETVGRFLDCWPDPLRSDTLRYATSYYAQALALDAELGTAAAVSGLSLLGFSWLVEDRHIYSRSAWKNMNTEMQIRALLEFSECRINTAVPGVFTFLQAVAQNLNATKAPDDADRDGLGCVITMRNHVVHPTREKRTKWAPYQWTEARVMAVHFLELALLAYVGYRQRYHPRITANPLARIHRRRPMDRVDPRRRWRSGPHCTRTAPFDRIIFEGRTEDWATTPPGEDRPARCTPGFFRWAARSMSGKTGRPTTRAGISRPWSSGWPGRTPNGATAGSTGRWPAWESRSRR